MLPRWVIWMKQNETVKFLMTALSILAAVNVFFIKRLVDNIDQVNSNIVRLQVDIAVIKAQMDGHSSALQIEKIGPSGQVRAEYSLSQPNSQGGVIHGRRKIWD